jgi:decaprenylphospho-beta-D-erythro-pentofuranosid-2-ulose 2-reductase
MDNAFGQPQTIVVLGGTSEIGVAIARALISPVARTIVLACRHLDEGERVAAAMRRDGLEVLVESFDATATDTHQAFLDGIAARVGDLDVVVLAFGQLGDGEATGSDVDATAALATVNFTGALTASVATANVLRRQGHGTLVVLSSVAGERVRKANFVYGSTKAGLDGFAQGLGDSLVGSGARVMVVRPGFVHSAMTEGMPAAPFATTPDAVAAATVAGLRKGSRTVWAPGILRFVFSALRHLPGPVWRRLPLG